MGRDTSGATGVEAAQAGSKWLFIELGVKIEQLKGHPNSVKMSSDLWGLLSKVVHELKLVHRCDLVLV